MKTRPCVLSFVVLSSLSSASFAVDELTFIGSLAYQNKHLTFDQNYSGAATNDARFSVNLPMVNAGLTLAIGKFFTAFKVETNLSDTSTTTNETNRSENLESNLLTHPGGTVDVDRLDVNFTVGYNVWKGLNVFSGYLYGRTRLNPDPFCANPFPSGSSEFNPGDPETTACSRSNRAFQQFFIGDNPGQETPPTFYVPGQDAYEQEYSERGFYHGVSYGFNIADVGTLSASIAYAYMKGKYKDNANDPNNAFGGSFVAFEFEGNSRGSSLALTWTSALGDNSAYSVDLRRQAYTMEGKDQTGTLSGVSLTTDEEMIGLTAGVQFYF